jgi:hypothetical protein
VVKVKVIMYYMKHPVHEKHCEVERPWEDEFRAPYFLRS